MASLTYARKRYRHVQLLSPSPRQTVLNAYSEAILACQEKDSLRAIKALAALQLSLNPNNTSELYIQLNTIFDYCIRLIQEEDFNTAQHTLVEIRSLLAS